jgi:hypothetical protein
MAHRRSLTVKRTTASAELVSTKVNSRDELFHFGHLHRPRTWYANRRNDAFRDSATL